MPNTGLKKLSEFEHGLFILNSDIEKVRRGEIGRIRIYKKWEGEVRIASNGMIMKINPSELIIEVTR